MRGLVRDEDRKAIAASVRSKGATDPGSPDDASDDEPHSASSAAAPERRAPGCSEALTKRLAAHRTMALQAMLAQNAAVALASVVHVFVLRTFGADYPREASVLQVSPQLSAYAVEAAADDLKTSRAWLVVQQAKEAWRALLPEHQGEWFGWLLGLPRAELIELLALCSALTANALPTAGAAGSANAVAAAVGLDMAEWWEPTPGGFLNHVPKGQIVAALKEAGTELACGGVEAMKKDALVTVAVSRLAGRRWLPEPLRRSPG